MLSTANRAEMKNVIRLPEREFQNQILELAELYKWRVHAERPARTKDGWRTPIQGEPGFPDLVLVRGSRLILAELKSDKGKVSDDQELWLKAFAQVCVVETGVWRPRDWEDIVQVLQKERP